MTIKYPQKKLKKDEMFKILMLIYDGYEHPQALVRSVFYSRNLNMDGRCRHCGEIECICDLDYEPK